MSWSTWGSHIGSSRCTARSRRQSTDGIQMITFASEAVYPDGHVQHVRAWSYALLLIETLDMFQHA